MIGKGYRGATLALVSGLGLVAVVLFLLGPTPAAVEAGPFSAPQTRPRAQATLVVTSTADDGYGTLRWALAVAGISDTVTFDPLVFPPGSPATITLQSALPPITLDGLTIDGSNAVVVLDGSGLSASSDDGLAIQDASGVVIRGLQVVSFPGDGIYVGNSTYCTIGGDRTVGAGPLGQGNLVSGNGGSGVRLHESSYNTIAGNRVGTDLSGTAPWGNNTGVNAYRYSEHNLIGGDAPAEGNLISANSGAGVSFDLDSRYNTIRGNLVGSDAAGTAPLGNGLDGVFLHTDYNTIGGEAPGQGNVIVANGRHGVYIYTYSDYNTLAGNAIGTDASGTLPLGNDGSGVYIEYSAHSLVGGDTTGAGNLIAYNGTNGVLVTAWSADHNWVSHNAIYSNTLRGIANVDGANDEPAPPTLLSLSMGTRSSALHLQGAPSSSFPTSEGRGKSLTVIHNPPAGASPVGAPNASIVDEDRATTRVAPTDDDRCA